AAAATLQSSLTQRGGAVFLASTTINGNATTTGDLAALGSLLDASGNKYVTSTANGASQWTTTSTGIYYNGGNVTVGTSVPNAVGSLFSATDAQGGIWVRDDIAGGNSPNIVMGYKDNYIDPASYGNIIVGGGANTYANHIYGTVAHY